MSSGLRFFLFPFSLSFGWNLLGRFFSWFESFSWNSL